MTSLLQTGRRMKELEYALMATETTGLAQLPIHLVRLALVDEEQNAWFLIPRPTQQSDAFGEKISVKLDFYKKGKPFFLSARGDAQLITQMTGVPDTEEFQSLRTAVWKGFGAAIKVQITEAEIFGEPAEDRKPASRGIAGALSAWYAWLFSPVMSA